MTPRLSVVMSVFNGAETLAETLDSVLAQTERDFELIVINDGSSDDTPAILARHARNDARIRVITQANAGLTRALIRGCDEARADVIARQDCGDVSLPRRFEVSLGVLDAHPACVLTSVAVEVIGPAGELLLTTPGGGSPRDLLLHAPPNKIQGLPHHGTAMFRKDAYRRCGGYRAEFYFAQDLDLWIRLAREGEIIISPETLYRSRVTVDSISSRYRRTQLELTRLAIALRDAAPAEREPLLAEVAHFRPALCRATRHRKAEALYFIASCLRRRNDPRASDYFRHTLRNNPLHARAWLSLLGLRR